MTAMRMRVRAELRARARGMVVLALVVMVAGGAALTALAGARRTDSAVDRFLAYSRSPDANVGAEDPAVLDGLVHLPQVAAYNESAFMLLGPGKGTSAKVRNSELSVQAIVRGSYTGVGRPLLLAGRYPRAASADEALINASGAAASGLGVGDRLQLQGASPDQAEDLLRGSGAPLTGPTVDIRIVGVGRFPFELSTTPNAPGVIYTSSNFLIMPPGFYRAYGEKIASAGGAGGSVRLRHGAADLPAFEAAAHRVSPDVFVDGHTDDLIAAAKAKDATRIEALALLLFSILAALVAVAFVAQTLARQAFLDAAEYPALGAMGMTRAQLVAVAAVRSAVVAVVGAAGAVALAFVLSPRMPIGLARQAEVDRGFSFDGRVLLLGALAIVVLVEAAAALAAWRTARSAGLVPGPVAVGAEQPSRLVAGLARSGVSPSAVVGVRMALEPGRGPTAVPVRTTLVSAAVAVAVLAGTLSFGASLHHLATTPVLQGWNWDVAVGNPHSDDVSETAVPLLAHNRDVEAFTAVAGPSQARVGGHELAVMGMHTVQGSVLPPFLEGRGPAGPDEIAVATRDLERTGKHVGEDVSVVTDTGTHRMRIVGRMVLTPSIVNGQTHIGDGALVTMDAFKTLVSSEGEDAENTAENVFAVRFKPGIDRTAALARTQKDFPGTVLTALRPADVENLRRVSALPALLAALIAAVAVLTVGHMLISSVRRRRHDVAILRTMGFVRRQVSAAVAWQATTVAVVGLVVGLPLGVAGGRWAWSLVADRLGVRFEPVVPALLLVGIVLGCLAIANTLASLPGVLAARTRPAEALRAE